MTPEPRHPMDGKISVTELPNGKKITITTHVDHAVPMNSETVIALLAAIMATQVRSEIGGKNEL